MLHVCNMLIFDIHNYVWTNPKIHLNYFQGRVAVIFKREYQFFENHVLRDELLFIDFFNGLLDRLQIRTHKPVINLEKHFNPNFISQVEGFAVLDMSV